MRVRFSPSAPCQNYEHQEYWKLVNRSELLNKKMLENYFAILLFIFIGLAVGLSQSCAVGC